VIFIVVLLGERDGRVLISHPYTQRRPARADRERPIPELPGKIEGLSHGLLLRQAQRVLGDLRLDARPHRTRRAEVPVRRRQSLDALVRALEVVVLDEQAHSPLTVLKVREHRAREQLLPKRLPEPLDLPAGLRMMRAALHVRDAMTLKLRLELGAAAPRGVLPPLVGQYLPRCPILRDPARERLQHQHASLVMRHREAHQVSGVIVQERGHIDALMPPQQERKNIRLPQLVRLRALEALHGLFASHALGRRLRLDPFGPEHPPHRRLGDSKPQEPPHHIPDAPTARSRLCLVGRQDRLGARINGLLQVRVQRRPFDLERLFSALSIRLHPLDRRRVRHPQLARHLERAQALICHRSHYRLPSLCAPWPSLALLVLVPRCARLVFLFHLSSPSLFLAQQKARQVLTDYAIIATCNEWFAAQLPSGRLMVATIGVPPDENVIERS
jgi:hypothetical protein